MPNGKCASILNTESWNIFPASRSLGFLHRKTTEMHLKGATVLPIPWIEKEVTLPYSKTGGGFPAGVSEKQGYNEFSDP